MRSTLFVVVLALLLLPSCGAAPTVEQPTPTPLVITQVVTQVVTQIVVQKETVVITQTPLPATATPRPSPTPQPAGKWKVREGTSSFDDSKTVVLSLEAERDITGPVGDYRPTLLLRCQEKTVEAYIDTGMQPDVEGLSETATARMRLDKGDPEELQMGKSTDGLALFFDKPGPFIDRLLEAEQLVFQFTPFSASPAEMTFDLRGLGEAIKPLREACP